MRKYVLVVLSVILVLSAAACGQNGNNESNSGAVSGKSANDTLSKAKEKGYITVGFANEKPYAYQTADGELTGEAVEIARAVLKELGINEMRGELTEFGSLIAGLQAERFDLITAGMFVNPERCSAVLFADPEYSIGEAIAVKRGNPSEIGSYKDIADNGDVKVAVMSGAVEIGYLEKSGVPADRIVQVPDQASAISALQAGRAQAITMTGPALQAMLDSANDSSIERAVDFEQPVIDGKSVRGYGATAFRQSDAEFQKAYNAELKKLKESGGLLEILKQFGFTEAELPGEMTAAALCQPQDA